jgi:tetratricopeptide (TPR) repeat protein
MARPTIELSMIVRNGAQSLDRCLASVAPLVDRIVIGDTGSTDATCSIAGRYGAECLQVAWTEDFAEARNAVLAAARCDWILVLDADEMLDFSQAASLLPDLLEDPGIHAYTLERWDYVARLHSELLARNTRPNPCYLPQARAYPAYMRSYHTRLFRRHPGVFYRECVHEQVTEQIDLLGLARAQAPLLIHHFGQVETPATDLEEKIRFYHRLGLRKLRDEPRNFEAHLQLGIGELIQMGNPEEALPYLRTTVALRPRDSRGWLYLGICLLRLARPEEAQKSLLRARSLGETNPALADALGDTYMMMDKYERALANYRKAHGIGGLSPTTDAKIGAAEVYLGDPEPGLERIRRALRRDPASALLKALLEVSEQQAAVQYSRLPRDFSDGGPYTHQA